MRTGRKLFVKLFLGNALLMVLVLGACVWCIIYFVDRLRAEDLTDYLKVRAETIGYMLQERFTPDNGPELDALLKAMPRTATGGMRVTLILPGGRVLADSQANPWEMANHADRQEIRQALLDGWGMQVRPSDTLGQRMKYVAVRLGPFEKPVGVVRVAMLETTIMERAETVQRLLWTVGLIGLGTVIVLALGLARLWSGPIGRITRTAYDVSRGDLSARVQVRGDDELSRLARAINDMRDHLARQMALIDRQRRTSEALLAQLHEGVIVAGPQGRMILMNPAARKMLGVADTFNGNGHGSAAEGRLVEECVANHELQEMLLPREVVSESADVTDRTESNKGGMSEARLQIHRAHEGPLNVMARAWDITLPGYEGGGDSGLLMERSAVGRLLVLTDITQLTEAMQVKVDFAANASHELRTPLSAIRGAVETLQKCDLSADAASARHFIGMIDKHSARMEQMVRDLLDLSRIETAPAQFQGKRISLRGLLAELHERHAEALATRHIEWQCDLSNTADTVTANPYLLRITLDNLIDNAIKFTEPGGQVRVCCRALPAAGTVGNRLEISVVDNGIGIAEEEQQRVFERFYQVERARSGTLRGTGLGLAIVRHAVTAMKGTVCLQSRLGHGTTVIVTLPQTEESATT